MMKRRQGLEVERPKRTRKKKPKNRSKMISIRVKNIRMMKIMKNKKERIQMRENKIMMKNTTKK